MAFVGAEKFSEIYIILQNKSSENSHDLTVGKSIPSRSMYLRTSWYDCWGERQRERDRDRHIQRDTHSDMEL